MYDNENLINEKIGNEVGLIENPANDEVEGAGNCDEEFII
jgi:hypothetical protein